MNIKENLTNREEEVLRLLIQGLSNPMIANNLCISIHTVKAHIESIYNKFGVHNRVQIAVLAVKNLKL